MAATFTTARIEAFSDGVIAVIITVMVLELKVPHENGLAGFLAIAPGLAVCALSFTFVGIYWINHHLLMHRVEHSNSRILRFNFIWLFCLSLLPFFTGYVLEKHEDSFSVALYAGSLLVTALAFMGLRLGINARQRREGRFEHEDSAIQARHWVSLGVYAAAIPLAFFFPVSTLCLIAFVTLLWIVPTFGADPLHPRRTGIDPPH